MRLAEPLMGTPTQLVLDCGVPRHGLQHSDSGRYLRPEEGAARVAHPWPCTHLGLQTFPEYSPPPPPEAAAKSL